MKFFRFTLARERNESAMKISCHTFDNSRLALFASRFSLLASRCLFLVFLFALFISLNACSNLPIIGGGAPTPSRQISYDGAVTLNVRAGETLAGTTIAYQGKAPDGRAIMSINGLQALKATADSVKWSGALVLFSLVDMNLRVVTYDETNMTLAGTIRIVVQEPNPTPAQPSANPMASFIIPVTYTVNKNSILPGSTVGYIGSSTGGAEFSNLDQFPFRERFDSVVWQGRLRERIAVRYDLRVLDFNTDRVILGGTANVMFEP